MVYWYQGKLFEGDRLELAIDDPGLLYGATVFTTLRVYDEDYLHPQTAWHLHRSRLEDSLAALSWQPPNWQAVETSLVSLSRYYPVLRVTLFPDGRELTIGRSLPVDLTQRQANGIVATLGSYLNASRSLPALKTGNYLLPWQTMRHAADLGGKEAILTDANGNWLETTTGNLWGLVGGKWWTPSLDGQILPGICRDRLLAILADRGSLGGECSWDRQFVDRITSLRYSNSVVESIPIYEVRADDGNRHFHIRDFDLSN
jgi:branched-subunit amino acid aminotransferase/4-amino-4-deoxychorismate lyase